MKGVVHETLKKIKVITFNNCDDSALEDIQVVYKYGVYNRYTWKFGDATPLKFTYARCFRSGSDLPASIFYLAVNF